jgi:hypothetical protein
VNNIDVNLSRLLSPIKDSLNGLVLWIQLHNNAHMMPHQLLNKRIWITGKGEAIYLGMDNYRAATVLDDDYKVVNLQLGCLVSKWIAFGASPA